MQYSGDAPGLVKGAVQINIQIPTQLGYFSGPGALQLYLQVGIAVSDPFTVYVRSSEVWGAAFGGAHE